MPVLHWPISMDRPSSPSHSSVITPPVHDHDNIRRLAKLITQAMLWTFSVLHYDAKSKTMVDWDWYVILIVCIFKYLTQHLMWCRPADDGNNMIPPDQFENYRKERNLKYPCCVCADGTQQTYVEAIVYRWWNATTRTWVWISRCATDRCTYEGLFFAGCHTSFRLWHSFSENWQIFSATITKHSRVSTQRLVLLYHIDWM
jgi:hypothetical protein